MPRLKKSPKEKLNDSINVPVNKGLKKRVRDVAARLPVPITKLARRYIERGVEMDELGTTN